MNLLRLLVMSVLGLVAVAPWAKAHEIRPAFLQIDERAPQRYEVLWKVPTRNGMVQDIRPVFASGLELTPQPGATVVDGFVIYRYGLGGDTALPGTRLRIDNLDRTTIDALINITLLDGTHHSFLLQPRESSVEVPAARRHPRPGRWRIPTRGSASSIFWRAWTTWPLSPR